MKRFAFIVGLALVGAGLALSQQPGADPWWRPLNPAGQSEGITYGNTAPTTNLVPGELFVDVDTGVTMFIRRAATWDPIMIVGGGGGTAQTIPVFDATGTGIQDSTVTDDATDVVATGGLLTVGTGVGAEGSILTDGNNSEMVWEGTIDGVELTFTVEDPTVGDMTYTLEDQQGQNVWGMISAAASTDIHAANAIWFDLSIMQWEGTTADAFELDFVVNDFLGGADVDLAFALPAAGAAGAVMTLGTTVAILDVGADIVDGFLLDLTNANHAGGFLNGIRIDDIVGDAQAGEYAIHIEAGWDEDIYLIDPGAIAVADGGNLSLHSPNGVTILDVETDAARVYGVGGAGTVIDIDHGLTTFMSLTPTLAANDNANDQRNVLLIDVDMPDGSSGLVNGINIDTVVDDINTIDSAIFLEGGWDASITMVNRGRASTSNPLTNTIGFYVSDDADYSGAGGVDCAFLAENADGDVVVVAILELNAACP